MVNAERYFDFQDIFINELIGDFILALIIGSLLILYFGIKLQIPIKNIMMILIAFISVMYGIGMGFSLPFILIILFVGFSFNYAMSRKVEQ